MKTTPDDPIISEIRRVRHEISAENGHDSKRMLEYYQKLQDEMRKSGEYRFVTGFFATSEPAGAVEKK